MLSETTKRIGGQLGINAAGIKEAGRKPDLAWSVPVMRVGFAGRGLVYLAVASFSLYAIWRGGRAQGTSPVLQHFEDSVIGDAVLALIALGMLAFAVWCAVDAIYDLDARGSDIRGIAARSGTVGSGLVGLVIAGIAFLLLFADLGGSGGTGSQAGGSHIDHDVATVMGWPAGRWI